MLLREAATEIEKLGLALQNMTAEWQESMLREAKLRRVPLEIAMMIEEIGESLEIYYEPRNDGMEWHVGLADDRGEEMTLHEHFASLPEGIAWIRDHRHLAGPRAR